MSHLYNSVVQTLNKFHTLSKFRMQLKGRLTPLLTHSIQLSPQLYTTPSKFTQYHNSVYNPAQLKGRLTPFNKCSINTTLNKFLSKFRIVYSSVQPSVNFTQCTVQLSSVYNYYSVVSVNFTQYNQLYVQPSVNYTSLKLPNVYQLKGRAGTLTSVVSINSHKSQCHSTNPAKLKGRLTPFNAYFHILNLPFALSKAF